MVDVLVILLSTLVPSVILFLGYRKFKKKMVVETTKAVYDGLPDPDSPVILHGHDLSKWHYLGNSMCYYTNEKKEKIATYPIFLFVSKNDEKRRSFYVSAGGKTHTFVERFIQPWAAGEGDVYVRIQGEDNTPSDYLKAYMFDKFSAEWDENTNWWGTSDKAKYNSAQQKQKSEKKPKAETKAEGNVVTVEFGKQA